MFSAMCSKCNFTLKNLKRKAVGLWFGLALGTGGEQMHATVNQLKGRAWGISNDGERLKVLMREQQIRASPMLENTLTKKKKKN